jgi:hypothetical protein
MRQALLLTLLVIPAFGAYRAFRYGSGIGRLWGAVPIALILTGALAPLVLGILEGTGAKPTIAGIGGGELVILTIVAPLLLAVVSGMFLSFSFGPRSR